MKGCDLPARDPFFLSPYNTETHTVFYICSDACAAAPICIRMRTQQSSIAHHTTQRDIYRNIEQALCCCREKGYWVTLNMRAQVDNRYVCAEIFANCLIANGQYGWKSHCSRVKMMRCDGPCSADYAKKSYPSLFAFHALRSCGWGGSNAHNTLIHVPRRQMFGSNVFISVIRA